MATSLCEPAVTTGEHRCAPVRPMQVPAAVLFERDGTLCVDVPLVP